MVEVAELLEAWERYLKRVKTGGNSTQIAVVVAGGANQPANPGVRDPIKANGAECKQCREIMASMQHDSRTEMQHAIMAQRWSRRNRVA